jgi:hypothetical protein
MQLIENWDDNLNPAINNIIDEYLLKHTIQIFVNEGKGFEPFGSGVLITTHGNYYLLSASHVVDHLSIEGNQLYVRVGFNKFVNISGTINFSNYKRKKDIDLGYINLDLEMMKYFGPAYKFMTLDKISNHIPILEGSNYCALGFPAKNIEVKQKMVRTGASFYITNAANEKPYIYYGMNQESNIIVNMKGKGTDLLKEGEAKIDSRFWGLSGGGLWHLTYVKDVDSGGFIVNYKLVGILTEFKKGRYYCFISTKIHFFIDALIRIEGLRFAPVKK